MAFKRGTITEAMLAVLVEEFEKEAFPTTGQRQAIARALNMTPRSVQIWFQNRRQRLGLSKPQTAPASARF